MDQEQDAVMPAAEPTMQDEGTMEAPETMPEASEEEAAA